MKPEEVRALIERVEANERSGGWAVSDVLAVCRLLREALAALDIETLRQSHDASFADPPSYHDDVDQLWECGRCVELYATRVGKAMRGE